MFIRRQKSEIGLKVPGRRRKGKNGGVDVEKSNKNKIVIGIAALLIAGIVAAAALLVSGQLKEKKYYEQLREARAYMISLDYDRGSRHIRQQ